MKKQVEDAIKIRADRLLEEGVDDLHTLKTRLFGQLRRENPPEWQHVIRYTSYDEWQWLSTFIGERFHYMPNVSARS